MTFWHTVQNQENYWSLTKWVQWHGMQSSMEGEGARYVPRDWLFMHFPLWRFVVLSRSFVPLPVNSICSPWVILCIVPVRNCYTWHLRAFSVVLAFLAFVTSITTRRSSARVRKPRPKQERFFNNAPRRSRRKYTRVNERVAALLQVRWSKATVQSTG